MRYIIGLLLGIGLIVLLFVLIFRGGGSTPKTLQKPLVSYANTSTDVSYTDDYPVNIDQQHNVVVTTVGRDKINVQVMQGYQGTVIKNQEYPNNPTAYANFLRALDLNGFSQGDPSPALRDDRGQCALGHRYIYMISDGSNTIQRYWATSCGNIGSSKAHSSTIRELFRRQAPDYNKLTTGLESSF
jgi:hypothetical protein